MYRKMTATIEEYHSDKPTDRDVAIRIVTFEHEGVPCFEVYRADFDLVETGDAESGPQASLELTDWMLVGAGMGEYHLR
jgi:hypothetical protein